MNFIKNIVSRLNPLAVILLLSPFFLYAITLLLPTFDDWTYYTAPHFGRLTPQRLLPDGCWWRPFDVVFGWILGKDCRLFPLLNHVFVYTGHLICTYIIYKVSNTLSFDNISRNIAAVFFFISPAMLGTVLGIDSLNQTYAQMWGLAATWLYLNKHCHRLYTVLWISCAYLATFSKENGIMFFFIPQVIAIGFGRTNRRQFIRDAVTALTAVAVYMAVRMALTPQDAVINEEYFDNTITAKLKNIAVFISMTWVAVDYVSIIYAPDRSLYTAFVTLLLSMPVMAAVFYHGRQRLFSRRFISLAACVCLAALPHLLTLFTVMHAYAGLGMAALLMAYLTDKFEKRRTLHVLFALYVASSLFIDVHHWQKARISGITGRDMGRQAIEKTGRKTDKIYIISVTGNERKYSSFCVIPSDAFGWGYAALAATGYKWPQAFEDTTIHISETHLIDSIADSAVKNGFEKVWLVHGDTVDVIR